MTKEQDPVMVEFKCDVFYKSDDSYQNKEKFRGDDPKQVLLSAIDELSRIAHLFGLDEEAMNAFLEARGRILDWRKIRDKK